MLTVRFSGLLWFTSSRKLMLSYTGGEFGFDFTNSFCSEKSNYLLFFLRTKRRFIYLCQCWEVEIAHAAVQSNGGFVFLHNVTADIFLLLQKSNYSQVKPKELSGPLQPPPPPNTHSFINSACLYFTTVSCNVKSTPELCKALRAVMCQCHLQRPAL